MGSLTASLGEFTRTHTQASFECVNLGLRLGPLQHCLPCGLIIVDEHRKILFENDRARTQLSAGCGLGATSGTFQIEKACVDRGFAHLVQRIAAGVVHDASRKANLIGIPDRAGRTRYVLKLVPFERRQTRSLFLVLIMDLMGTTQVSRARAAKVFQLSEREAELAELFSLGLRVDEIAGRMGVSLNTARVHLRNVFTKTGCSNQIDLARTFTILATQAYLG